MPVSPTTQQETEEPLPASGDVNTPDALPVQPMPNNPTAPVAETRPVSEAPNAMAKPEENLTGLGTGPDLSISPDLVDNTPDWVKAGSYEELVKTNPNVSRAQYAHGVSKYRREQGQPDLSYQEWANIIRNRNPFETEAERQKREKRLRRAEILNGVGSVLGNLVNYVRARNGNVAMNLSDGTEGYNRIERIRQGQEQLGRIYAKDYMGAIAQDRAERAKEAAAAASAAQRERDYRLKEAELKVKIENARSERERKAAADELARMKFKHQQETDAAKLKETQRNHQAQEAVSWHRAKNGGGSDDIGSTATADDGTFMTRKKPLSKEEAYQIVANTPDSEGFHEMFRTKTVTTNENGQTVRTGDVDWEKLAGWLIAQKKVPKSVLKNMGYKGGKSEKQRDYSEYMEDDFSDLKE